jgi:ubiquitin-protein ligase
MNKRLLKELRNLYMAQSNKPLLENDYLIDWDENDMSKVHAIIKAPPDSVYRHKFVRLDFKIPDNYPHSPPDVSFVNWDAVRIHPNFYENGKCCATILNTWGESKFEKWTSSMGIETILIMFHSFLDNKPYVYEPGDRDDSSYTTYVLHQSWMTCLVRYLQYEKIDLFNSFIHTYLLSNIDEIFQDLQTLQQEYPVGYYSTRCFEIDDYFIDYQRVIEVLSNYYHYIDFNENVTSKDDAFLGFDEFMNTDYKCNICYDTHDNTDHQIITLECCHQFHKSCLHHHLTNNNNVCPMCRREVSEKDMSSTCTNPQPHPEDVWIINPQTKRRVKKGSKTYRYLIDNGIIEE